MASVCLSEKFKGKPDAGNLHVRFDEGEGYSLPTLLSGCGGLLQNITESLQKPVSIGIVFAYDMMQDTRRLPAIASSGEAGGHLFWLDVVCDFITTNNEKETPKINPVPLYESLPGDFLFGF